MRKKEESKDPTVDYPVDPKLDKEQNVFTQGLVKALHSYIKGTTTKKAASVLRLRRVLVKTVNYPEKEVLVVYRYYLISAEGCIPPEKEYYTKADLDAFMSDGYTVFILGDVE